MPTKKRRHYCIKCGKRKIAPKMIKVTCTKVRYGYDYPFSIYFCHTCAERFRSFLNGVALDGTPFDVKSVAMAATPKVSRIRDTA